MPHIEYPQNLQNPIRRPGLKAPGIRKTPTPSTLKTFKTRIPSCIRRHLSYEDMF